MSTLKISQINLPAPLVVIVGPTAVGKTETAITLAERLGAEIVSADSRYFYRGMDIGTAKPTPAERVRVPHHLIDVANPDQTWSVATFQREAKKVIEQIHARDRLPLLVGGTGLYVHAVLQGWEVPPQEPDQKMRSAIEHWGEQIGAFELHQRLARLDMQAARNIDPRNVRRTVRALEVIFGTGRRFSEQGKRGESPYSTLMVGLIRPREELYGRIDARIDAMLGGGFIEEVGNLLEAGYAHDLPVMSAIGYREVGAYLRGLMTLDEAKTQMKRLTRQFVRRQSNWFRLDDPSIHWFPAGSDAAGEIEHLVRSGAGWTRAGQPGF